MSAIAPALSQTPRIPPFPVRRFTVEEYHRMVRSGVLAEKDSVELLEGWIVPKMPHNPNHAATIDQASEVLRGKLPPPWRIRIQSAITTEDSEPEPDLALVLGPASRYSMQHPGLQDIAVVIEVADSSLAHDRDVKGRLYARARIPHYWIINLIDGQIELYSGPSGSATDPRYQQHQTYGVDDLVPLTIGGEQVAEIAVRDLLM